MKKYIVAVRDSAMDAFMNPFVVPNTALAVRSFRDECNKQDSPMNAHPEDYELYCIGEYDEDTARIFDHDNVLLIRGKDCVVKQ